MIEQSARRYKLITAAILAVGLVIGLKIAWGVKFNFNDEALENGAGGLADVLKVTWGDLERIPLQDDSFYNFSIARNLAFGHGPTYDGVHKTNGFHPIVVGTMSILYRLFDGDTGIAVHVLLTMMILVNLATVLIFQRMVSRRVAPRAGLILSFLWIMSPFFWWMFLNGMDTGVNIMLIVLSLSVYLGRIRDSETPSTGAFVVLGLLLGLVVLSRMDGLILVGVIGLDVLIRFWRRGGMPAVKSSVFRLAILSAGVCIIVGPWVKFNIDVNGSPVQISGQAVRFMSVLKLPKDRDIDDETFFDRDGDLARINRERVDRFNRGRPMEPSFYMKNFALVAAHLAATYPLLSPIFIILNRAGLDSGNLFMASRLLLAAGAFGALLAAVAAFVFLGGFRRQVTGFLRSTHMPGLGILWAFSALLVIIYVFYIMGWMFYFRYLFIINILLLVHAAIGIHRLLEPAEGGRTMGIFAARGLVCILLAIFIASSIWANSVFKNDELGKFKELVDWMEENLEKDARIGVFQSGIINYLSSNEIVPLSGKISIAGFEAAREGKMYTYVMEKDLDYIVEDPRVLEVALIYRADGPIESEFTIMEKQRQFWVLKRIRKASGAD